MADLAGNLGKVRDQIAAWEQRYQRVPGSVRLLAVTKGRSVGEVRAALDCGQRDFGENYLQEAVVKIEQFDNLEICWHFIGPIQSNKTRAIAQRFDWVHSVDRIKIARRLNDMRPVDASPLNICIELNISNEPGKSGIGPDTLHEFATAIREFPRLKLRGLMTMPEPVMDFAEQRKSFRRLYDYYTRLNADKFNLDTLSMGTSGDMEAAIAEGATMIRIGTAIFGPRP